jgi:hypothetical protein
VGKKACGLARPLGLPAACQKFLQACDRDTVLLLQAAAATANTHGGKMIHFTVGIMPCLTSKMGFFFLVACGS